MRQGCPIEIPELVEGIKCPCVLNSDKDMQLLTAKKIDTLEEEEYCEFEYGRWQDPQGIETSTHTAR